MVFFILTLAVAVSTSPRKRVEEVSAQERQRKDRIHRHWREGMAAGRPAATGTDENGDGETETVRLGVV